MLSVIMECRNQEQLIAQSLASLVTGSVQGLVSDVILLDHGSSDGTAALADAVGCRHVENFDLQEVLKSARGQWILVIEPGARIMQTSWTEEIPEFIGLNLGPARFSPSPYHEMPIWKRFFMRRNPLENGLLISKEHALRGASFGLTLSEIAKTSQTRKLLAQMVPAWVLASKSGASAAL